MNRFTQVKFTCTMSLLCMYIHFSILFFSSQTLPVEMMGKDPLCMVQYFKVLSSCRVPCKKADHMVSYPPTSPDAPTHIVVVHNNQVNYIQCGNIITFTAKT